MNTTRHAYRMPKAGNLRHLQKVEEALPAPHPHEVRIAVKAIGLNFADIFAILGLYSATPKGSFVPGLEYAGIVIQVGAEVSNLKVGDKVMGVTRFGGYTTHLNIDQRYAVPLPQDWSFAQGAAFPVQALTAYYALFNLGELEAGETVLIHSAAGGVGLLANRMAKKKGAYTIGSIGSEKKIALLKQEGYDDYIVRGKHFGQQLKETLKDRKLDLVLECIGGNVLMEGWKQLAPQGRLVVYGSARYGDGKDKPNFLRLLWLFLTRPKIDPQATIQENKAVLGFNLIWLYEKAELMHQIFDKIKALQLPVPYIGHTFSFEELPQALKLFQSGQTVGKVIVEIKD
ncbi:zinc-binding dehydrogenase [Cytophagales bacterium LB-30]|uniref:Zinc-binding dehydrogenase n=1 Tax=Shiella aurantiaca TaxID=3058365 RepID=A0ABT8F0Q0_9BACT|nr:zinc-binding dehydrogenase [Shiella aurantiaca]MDN4163924.1 zinc-binding dehydrogenase [Shiella aurantiaca]